jgi:PTS system ascorbate-specific IIA component
MLLREMVEKRHCNFIQRAESWEDSIKHSCAPLVADGTVNAGYADEIINCVRKHGPYIIIMPGFALPHSMENSDCAHGTAISFMKTKEPVSFDDNDPDKTASIFFTLASVNSEEHLLNMRKLFKMLTNEQLCADLQGVQCTNDLLLLDDRHSIKEE